MVGISDDLLEIKSLLGFHPYHLFPTTSGIMRLPGMKMILTNLSPTSHQPVHASNRITGLGFATSRPRASRSQHAAHSNPSPTYSPPNPRGRPPSTPTPPSSSLNTEDPSSLPTHAPAASPRSNALRNMQPGTMSITGTPHVAPTTSTASVKLPVIHKT